MRRAGADDAPALSRVLPLAHAAAVDLLPPAVHADAQRWRSEEEA